MVMSVEGGKPKMANKKNGSAVTVTSVKQKSLTTSPQKQQVKKAPDKLECNNTQQKAIFLSPRDDNWNDDEVQAISEDANTSSHHTSPVQD